MSPIQLKVLTLFSLGCAGFAGCTFPALPPVDEVDASTEGSDGGPPKRTVTVIVDPLTAIGAVIAPTVGIDCGSTCVVDVPDGTSIDLTAVSTVGAAFAGWRTDARACGGTTTCSLQVAGGSLTVGARFATQGQLAWLRQVGGILNDRVTHLSADASGNVVVAAEFRGDLTFDGATYLGGGVLLTKISPAGDLVWKQAIAGLGTVDTPLGGLAVDPIGGDVFVYGSFTSPIELGGPTLTLPPGDVRDAFIARFDRDGTWQWQRTIKISDRDEHELGGIALDGAGGLFIVGSFNEWFDVGDGQLATTEREMFVAKLPTTGSGVVWKRKIGGPTSFAYAHAVAVDSLGNVLVGGSFAGGCSLGGPVLAPNGITDAFLASYAGTNGVFRWQKQVGGSGDDDLRVIASDRNSSRVYAAVSYTAVGAEPITFSGTAATGGGGAGQEVVVAAMDYTGTVAWARRIGSTGADGPSGLAVLPDSSVAIVGGYGADLQLDATTLVHAGGGDGFVARLSAASGSATFAERLTSGAADSLTAVAATSSALIVGGSTAAQATVFGGGGFAPAMGLDGFAAATLLPP